MLEWHRCRPPGRQCHTLAPYVPLTDG
jgi:hypothetical protein